MALSEYFQLPPFITPVQLLAIGGVFAVIFYLVFIQRPSFPSNAPHVLSNDWPIFGSLRFWNARRDFWVDAVKESKTGNFSYHLGKHPVIGVSSKEGRDVFLNSRDLGFGEGYAVLFGQSPSISDHKELGMGSEKEVREMSGADHYFSKRITAMLRREQFMKALPTLLSDVKIRLDELGSEGLMDPFKNIYEIVYLLTMRAVGATEIANSRPMLDKTLNLFEMIEKTSTSYQIMFPWLPSPAMFNRLRGGSQMYMIFRRLVEARKKEGRREDDALQFLIDQGDDVTRIIGFVVGALFAGQLNSGINSGTTLCYLAANPKWIGEIRREIASTLEQYTPGDKSPAVERLAKVPLDGWENDFPTVEICLRESIRLQLPGTAFRKNVSGKEIRINEKEVIPPEAFVTYHVGEHHLNPALFADPYTWDPSRFQGPNAEDKKTQNAFIGWGTGRHPCLGMRFAKLEQNIITAYFLTMFDFELCDTNGNKIEKLPDRWENHNNWQASKPDKPVRLRYWLRKDGGS